MAEETDNMNTTVDDQQDAGQEHVDDWQPPSSKLMRLYSHPWSQILLISFICFCLPGVGARLLPWSRPLS